MRSSNQFNNSFQSYVLKKYVFFIASVFIDLRRVHSRYFQPLSDGMLKLFVSVVHHELGLSPLEVGLHDPVPHLLVLIQGMLKTVLLVTAVTPCQKRVAGKIYFEYKRKRFLAGKCIPPKISLRSPSCSS